MNINICGIKLLCSHERKKIPQLSIEYQIMPNDNIQYIYLIVTLVNGMIFRTAVDSHVAMQLCQLWKHFSSSSRIVMSGKSEKLQVEGSSFIMEMPSLQPECGKSQSGEETHDCLLSKIRFPILVRQYQGWYNIQLYWYIIIHSYQWVYRDTNKV